MGKIEKCHFPPNAKLMIESLRGLGYSTETAIADIIDNSISANASHIDIKFKWEEERSSISISDNGTGMTGDELEKAMRLGYINPLERRGKDDLGRFGIGLKTASFSQCRLLTVFSRKNHEQNCYSWDLEYLESCEDDGWYLLKGFPENYDGLCRFPELSESGTAVVWSKLDRIMVSGYTQQSFLDLIDKVEYHISMVFHRYISRNEKKINIYINNRKVKAWDPFLENYSSTWISPIETINKNGSNIKVQSFVLPPRWKLDDETYGRAGGPNGWTAQQGFYVYRNERLIVAGSWLGLGIGKIWTKEETCQLARIKIDITNNDDVEWKIDVKKSSAKPPIGIREQLSRIAADSRSKSKKVFMHRSEKNHFNKKEPFPTAWYPKQIGNHTKYLIDRDHPAVKVNLKNENIGPEKIELMLRIIEETVPVQKIWINSRENNEQIGNPNPENHPELIVDMLKPILKSIINEEGLSIDEAKRKILSMEPFNKYPDVVAKFNLDENSLDRECNSEFKK